MRKVLTIAFLSLLLAVAGVTILAADKPQTKCPISGEAVDHNVFVDYQGQRIYFCCDKCPAKFKTDPEKYFAQFAQEGIVLENVQKVCPMSGEEVSKTSFTDYKGRRVYFCCNKCITEFKKNPEAMLNKLPGAQSPAK